MSRFNVEELMECFSYVEDPRVQGRSKHLFIDILVISVCATLCGAEACTEIELFARQKEEWLKRFLELPCGIPSHDTISRVLSLVDPLQMEAAFRNWVESVVSEKTTKRLSLDGKSVAGTERHFKRHPLHMVSAYSHELGLTLIQTEAAYRGTGEAEAALECLKALDIKGVTVLADAALSIRRIPEQIRAQGGHYILPIKGNQRLSREEMAECFEKRPKGIKKTKSNETNRGRQETRVCEALTVANMSEKFLERWPDVKTLLRITRMRTSENKASTSEEETKTREDVTYYVTDLELDAKQGLKEVRVHWSIENKLHWHLDVAFSEDQWRVRAKALARTLTLLRKIAMNIVRTSNTKGSVRGRMKQAGWNNAFLSKLVFNEDF